MKYFHYLVLLAGLCASVPAFAQSSPDLRAIENARLRAEREKRVREENLEKRRADMRSLESRARTRGVRGSLFPAATAEWNRRVKELRRVDPAYLAKYADFLKHDNTGIFQLLPNYDCLNKSVVRVDGNCASFVPETSDFSFRTGKHTYAMFHDIGLNNDVFASDAFFTQGILVSLGNVPIENVHLGHKGLGFLAGLTPDSNPEAARLTAARISKGVEWGGYVYKNQIPAAEGTFALRVIAYRLGNGLPRYHRLETTAEKKFLHMGSGGRDDVIVVFSVVGRGADGGLTIIWKELQRQDAPKLRFAKGEPLDDFK